MPKVLDITYICQKCKQPKAEWNNSMICHICRGPLKGEGFPGVTGTRDSFGIGRKFYHRDENGVREIETWKGWERAGYKDAISATGNKNIAKMAKDKMKRIKQNGGKSML